MNIPGRRLSDVVGLLNLVVLHRTIAVLEGFGMFGGLQSWFDISQQKGATITT